MKTRRPVRVGIFRDPASARRVLDEAFRLGFRNVHVVAQEPATAGALLAHPVCARGGKVRRSPGQITMVTAFVGALVGLAVGFAGAWFASGRGIFVGIGNLFWPAAGLIWGGFIGAMLSRGFTLETQNFYDQELSEGEILVAIEEDDPGRLLQAEEILRHAGVAPIPLREG